MAPPRRFFHVAWRAARTFDTPLDRVERTRNFASAERAAEQVAAIARVPDHAQLLGVWTTTGYRSDLEWEPVDPDTLPYDRQTRQRHQSLIAGWKSHPDPSVQAAAHRAEKESYASQGSILTDDDPDEWSEPGR